MVAYTLLLLTRGGIILRDHHLRRLGLDAPGSERARQAFSRFAAAAAPGTWAVWREGDAVRAEPRPGTRLHDGMPARFAPSPVPACGGPIAKPAPPGPYDGVRRPGVATLLTSRDGAEIYEACSAAVLGWSGERVICVPLDRPRVWSTSEAAVREHLPIIERPIPARAPTPILLVNAVKGTCAAELPGRDPFPEAARSEIERLLRALTA